MLILIVLGWVALVIGLLFLFAPGALIKFGEWMNRPIFVSDSSSMTHRCSIGISLVIFGLCLFLIAFLSLSESETVENDESMIQETEIIDALFRYPELTYIDEALIMLERYEKIEI